MLGFGSSSLVGAATTVGPLAVSSASASQNALCVIKLSLLQRINTKFTSEIEPIQ